LAAQQSVPVVDLAPATVHTSTTIGGVLGIREVAGGKVLVNDIGRRQLLMFDTTLASARVIFDSMPGLPNSYGPVRIPLIAYIGDSSLMVDLTAGPASVLVIDGQGKVVRSLALPNPMDAGALAGSMAAIDNAGRIVYALTGRVRMPREGSVGAQ